MQWSIHVSTLSELNSSITPKKLSVDDVPEQYIDWMRHETEKMEAAISLLNGKHCVFAVRRRLNGTAYVSRIYIQLWIAGNDAIPPHLIDDISSIHFGLSWWCSDKTKETNCKLIPLSDVSDITIHPIDEVVEGKEKFKAHTCSRCKNVAVNIISIHSKNGHSLDILSCCAHGQQNLFLAIKNICLYIKMMKDLNCKRDAIAGNLRKGKKKDDSGYALKAAPISAVSSIIGL